MNSLATEIEVTPGRIEHPSVWTRYDLDSDDSWRQQLTPSEVGELRGLAASLPESAAALGIDRTGAPDLAMPILSYRLAVLSDELENGRGIALVKGLPLAGLSVAQLDYLYAGIVGRMGRLIVQDTAGTLIDRVSNRGLSYDDIRVRGYTTNAELTPHCDSGDVIGLLCIRPAPEGGINTLISAIALYQRIRETHPEYLGALHRGFHYNIRGNGPPGPWQDVTRHRVPVFSLYAGRLSVRFNEKAIKTAAELPGVAPLSKLELAAIDYLVALSKSEEFGLRVALEAGDLLLLSNHSVLHTRDAFVDGDTVDTKRLLLRAWINLYNARPLRDDFADHYNTGPREGPWVASGETDCRERGAL